MKSLIYGLINGLIVGIALHGTFALAAEHDRRATGDTLEMPASSAEATNLPTRGTGMAQVESRWGAPQSRLQAVGNPPISRWIYGDFTVYFEHDLVIHSVRHRATTGNSS